MLAHDIYRVYQEIRTHGKTYTVYQDVLDGDGEPTGEKKAVISFCGLFHIEKGYSQKQTTTGTITHGIGEPMILCMWKDAEEIKRGMFLDINEKRYNITDINNVGEENEIADLSLEVVIDGGKEY